MIRIHLATDGEKLIKVSCPKITSGDRNVDYLKVDCCPTWTGYTKTAVFYRTEDDAYYALLNDDNECVIPWEVLQTEGLLYFGIFGVKEDLTLTSEILTYKIEKGAITENIKPSDPTPDIYSQIIEKYNDLARKYEDITQLCEELTQVCNNTVEVVNAHEGNKENPHGVTKEQIGLGNVPNVATNDQTPTFTAASTLTELTTGEKISVAFGKIAKAITDLISHIGNKSNPHGVTAAQAGAVPTSRTVNGKALSSNITLSASDVGAAPTDTYEKLHQKTKIPSGADLNTYTNPGSFAIVMATEGAAISNVPYASACGTLIVTSMRSTVEDGNCGGVWQKFYGYEGCTYERCTRDGSSWDAWKKFSLDGLTGTLGTPKKGSVIYSTIDEMGLGFTASCTTEEFAKALPGYSNVQFMHRVDDTIHLTDCPCSYGTAEFHKGPNNSYVYGFMVDIYSNVFVYKYHSSQTATNGWKRVSSGSLWTNASPTSTFNGQTITVSGMKFCRSIMVVLQAVNGCHIYHIAHRDISITHANTPTHARYDNGHYTVGRAVGVNFTNNTIQFGHGNQNGTQNQGVAVPIVVIGLC